MYVDARAPGPNQRFCSPRLRARLRDCPAGVKGWRTPRAIPAGNLHQQPTSGLLDHAEAQAGRCPQAVQALPGYDAR